LEKNGADGVRTRDFPCARRILYLWATTPYDVKSPKWHQFSLESILNNQPTHKHNIYTYRCQILYYIWGYESEITFFKNLKNIFWKIFGCSKNIFPILLHWSVLYGGCISDIKNYECIARFIIESTPQKFSTHLEPIWDIIRFNLKDYEMKNNESWVVW
jgi:hypothetical protein